MNFRFQDFLIRFPVIVYLFLCIASSCPVQAQQVIRSLTVSDGLPQGWVIQMAQDRQGFIWIASKGLSRYDGTKFKTWHHTDGDTTTLADDNIREMHLDSTGNLWLVYFGRDIKVDVLNTVTGRVRHISSEQRFKWIKKEPDDSFIKQAAGQFFYCSGFKLMTFNPKTGVKIAISLPVNERLVAIGQDKSNQIWISTQHALYQLINNKLVLKAKLQLPATAAADAWDVAFRKPFYLNTNIVVTGAKDVFIPAPGGVFVYQEKTRKLFYSGDTSLDELALGVTDATDGNIYMTLNRCLYKTDGSFKFKLVYGFSKNFWLSSPILADRFGTLWAATGTGTGIRILNLHPQNFHSYAYKQGFSHDVLQPWLKTPGATFDASSYKIRSAIAPDLNEYVLCPGLLDADGKEYPESYIYQLTKNGCLTKKFTGYNIDEIAFAKGGQCWALISQRHLNPKTIARLNLGRNTFERFQALPNDSAYNLEIDQYLAVNGRNVCVLSPKEIRLYDTLTKACRVYASNKLGTKNDLLMIANDPRLPGEMWIATKTSGIIRLNTQTGHFRHFTQANGLPDNTVYFMAPDDKGFFWCSSNSGIFRYNPADGKCVLFTIKDGLQGNEFNRYHFLKTPDGHFIFGGTDGYTVFHPDSMYMDNNQTTVVIPDILVNNKPLRDAIPTINDEVSSLHHISLNYDQNFLSIGFTGLEYNLPDKLQYRYRLEGFDQGWVSASNKNASYTFIPPGDYTFKVTATNSAGAWSNKVTTLLITIRPPWWKTWWAYVLYLVGVVSLGYALYRNQLQRAETKQQIILRARESEQLRAVDEMKSRFFSNITHEFRTPLSLILGPAGQMLNEEPVPAWKKQMVVIERNARQLLRLVNQLMDMAKLDAKSMRLSFFRGDLNDFMADQVDAFKPATAAKELSLSLQGEISHDDYLFDADKLQTILSNILSNAVKFTPAGKTICVSFSAEPVAEDQIFFQIVVQDNGPGIAAEKLPFVFDRFYQAEEANTRRYEGTGIGLALVKELAELMGGQITVASKPNEGACFTLRLPMKKADGAQAARYVSEVRTVLAGVKTGPKQQTEGDLPVILIAEDNNELREFLVEIFNTSYRVLQAGNGLQGFTVAKEDLPEVIISDLMMPEMDGYEFCKAIKTDPETDHIAFLLLTAKTSKLSLIAGLQNQADDYITKPFIAEELLLRVGNLISRQQALREYFQQQLKSTETETSFSNTFLESIYRIIDKHLADPNFNVDQLSADLAMSRRTLNRKLSNTIGLPASEVIKIYKLKKAAEFLRRGRGVAETTYEIGYESPAYFSTMFKSVYGVAPSAYYKD